MSAANQTLSNHISATDVVGIGEAELALAGHDIEPVITCAQEKYLRLEGFRSDAVNHYYGKLGYSESDSHQLLDLVLKFMALSASWHELGMPGLLSLPERVDNDGWHGFIIQTRDYTVACERLGVFIHHATTGQGQGEAVSRTLALLFRTFGPVDQSVWADCPGCVIYGWCSSGTD